MGQQRLSDQLPATAESGSCRKINPDFAQMVKWGENTCGNTLTVQGEGFEARMDGTLSNLI